MRTYIKTIINIIEKQLYTDNNYKLIKLENFSSPRIYLEVCNYLKVKLNNKEEQIVAKLSKEKYEFWKGIEQFKDVLKEMDSKDLIERSEHLTKWRNFAFNDSKKELLLILMGTEEVEDQGGLEDFYTISPETVEREIGDKYSKLFTLDESINFKEEDCVKIDSIFKSIFALVEKDLVKLSYFVENCNNLNDIKKIIAEIFNTLYNWWGLPNIRNILSLVDISTDFSKVNNILINAFKFNRRIGMDNLPSENKLKKIELGIIDYKEKYKTEIQNEFSEKFPDYKDYDEFSKDLINYVKGIKIDEVKDKLSSCDFNVINYILNYKTKVKNKTSTKPKEYKVYGDPVKALIMPILYLLNDIDCKYKTSFNKITLEIKEVKLSNTKANDNEKLILKWNNICRFLGGIENLVNDLNITNRLGEIVTYDIFSKDIEQEEICKFYPFRKENTNHLLRAGILVKGSASEQKSKIKFKIEIYQDDKRLEFRDYEWNIFDTDSWVNSFYVLDSDSFKQLTDKKSFIPIGNGVSVNELIDSTNEDEFLHILRNSKLDYLNVQPKLDMSNELTTKSNKLGKIFNDFINSIDKEGLFNTIKNNQKAIEFLNTYNDLLQNMISSIRQYRNLPMIKNLSKAFLLLNEYTEDSKVILGAIIPPYHPVMLEKIIERYIYLSNGFKEMYEELLNLDSRIKDKIIEEKFDRFDQLSTITFAADLLLGKNNKMISCSKAFGFYAIYGQVQDNYNISNKNLDYFKSEDLDDIKGKLSLTPISRYISRVITDYIKVHPSKIDGITLMFFEPKDYKDIIAGLKYAIDNLKELGKLKIKLIVYTTDFKVRGKEYIKYWIENTITEDDNIAIESYMKYLDISTSNLKAYIKDNVKNGDIVFLQDIMTTIELSEEKTDNRLQIKNTIENRYPAVYLPVPCNEQKKRKISISQPQFYCEYIYSQLLIYLNNPNIQEDRYRIIEHLALEDRMRNIIELLHNKASWVVILDQSVDSSLINYDNTKVIGFSTGEGYFGELNTTISSSKEYLNDLQRFVFVRLRNRFSNWQIEEYKKASEICISYADKLDGAEILKAINPNDQSINNYLAYLMTAKLENIFSIKPDKFYLRKLISLDSYSHLFDDNLTLSLDSQNLRPDFLLIEIPKSSNNLEDDSVLNIRANIIECKIGNYGENRVIEAQKQLLTGYQRLRSIWNTDNESVQKRFWNNQLYRLLSYNEEFQVNPSINFNTLANKLIQINEGNYNIYFGMSLFTYWLNKEIPEGIEKNILDYEGLPIEHFSLGVNVIKELLVENSFNNMIEHSYIKVCNSLNGKISIEKENKIEQQTIDNINEEDNVMTVKNNKENINYEKELNRNDYDQIKYYKKDTFISEQVIEIFNEIDNPDLENEKQNIEEKLSNLRLELESRKVKIYPKEYIIGPDIIRISLELGHGVNIEQLKRYKENMKLWLSVNELPYIFIENGMVKLDIVRPVRQTVGLKEVLNRLKDESNKYWDYTQRFYALLGVNILGAPYVIDFSNSNTPHLLIAGQTGSGKSVLLYSILTSIMVFYNPDEVEMYLVDPKKVELTAFRNSPFTKEIATEVDDALNLLEKLVEEMNKRYNIFMNEGVRNIYEYNKKVDSGSKMKRLIMVFDEYATMMEAGSESVKRIESAIKSLSQMARAAGIHLIICTQSPRSDIITTTIRNNLTARVGLRTADANASSLILDEKGAESLLGKGDMWLKTAESSNLTRLKSPFITRQEISNLIDLIKRRGV